MDYQLDPVEVRVLGSLMEKEATTPEYYPLSLNALVNACNQKSNRDPVVSYDETTVEEALDRLRSKNLAVRITGHEVRVPKHAHRLAEVLNLGRREAALLCVLLLRGPQTLGELRGRAERMYNFDDLNAVQACLQKLIDWEPAPLVQQLPRQAGFKEPRFAHRLSGDVQLAAPNSSETVTMAGSGTDRLSRLEAEVESLRREVDELRRVWEEFQR